jgi:exopolysaccharide biosynthesis protein
VIRWVALGALVVAMTAGGRAERAVEWRNVADGIQWRELSLDRATVVVLVRADPSRVRFTLASATRDYGMRGAWTVDSAPREAVLAVNAGQFAGGTPWGWVVRDGVEIQPPGYGPLATAVVIDSAGTVRLVRSDSVGAERASHRAVTAFESYPTLLWGNAEMPAPLRAPGRGVDLEHRDSRVALGIMPDGAVIIALTRFLTDDGRISTVPLGPTIPEMATLMRELGCQQAVALDGGISGQMILNGRRWPGYRRVPLALIATAAGASSAPHTH